ncbi:MAG: 6,7-dimethyl-8-ribityllumazine synthase [Calditrichaeota bacterium]|nr:6,7-dimethyl-8-ribityllumazine synthase [Calditrichota bacterium]MCB9391637.1 6,7-dimethyl-8-ribityllumazine synthase [Calditrichota bacterium]
MSNVPQLLPSGRTVIVCSSYHANITSALLEGAREELTRAGVPPHKTDLIMVPGAFELPTAAAVAARRINVDLVICLGAVVRGETPHFDFICNSCALGISRAAEDSGKPVTFGVITANTVEQAFERAGGRVGNKGTEAARAALELYSALKHWEKKQATG